MATRLYPLSSAASYTPTTFKGTWSRTSNALTRGLATDRTQLSGSQLSITKTPTQTDGFAECLLRFVSEPLPAGSVAAGSLNFAFEAMEGNAGDNATLKVHAYLTQGSTDSVRATLVADYVDATEVSSSTTLAVLPSTPPSVAGFAITAGDRLVVEVGYQLASPTAAANISLYYDGNGALSDLAAGNFGSQPAWVEVADLPTEARVSQAVAEAAVVGDSAVRLSQLVAEAVVSASAAAVKSRSRAFVIG